MATHQLGTPAGIEAKQTGDRAYLRKRVASVNSVTDSPIAMVATSPLVLFGHPSVAVHDVRELIAYSRDNPGRLSVGTPGLGTPHHLAAAWLNTGAKIHITHVPYRGATPALNDLLGGQIPLIWASPVAVLPFVAQGKVEALAVSTLRRDRMLPDVPTVSESGVPGFDYCELVRDGGTGKSATRYHRTHRPSRA
jgi:tripartite-type tricarboxylate transporter receptor subunit TctC